MPKPPTIAQAIIDDALSRTEFKEVGRIRVNRAMKTMVYEQETKGAMKLSKLIDYLEQALEREGDIPVANKDGKPFSFVDVEQLDGNLLYNVVTKP